MRSWLLVAIGSWLQAATAEATPLFPAGAESKTAGVESSLVSEGPPAMLYNPANLKAGPGRAEPYAELGFVSVTYSYEHPDFDPVVVSVVTPVATFGYAQKVNERLSLGAVIFPSQSGKTDVPGLPKKVGGSITQALEVDAQDQVIDIGAGGSYRVTSDLSLGLAVDHAIENHKLRANAPGNDTPLVDMSYHNQFDRPVLGATYQIKSVATTTLAFRPAQARAYKGSETLGVSEQSTSPKVRTFQPTTVSAGVGGRLAAFNVGLEMQRQGWSAGRGIVQDGLSNGSPEADLRDVTDMSVTAGYALSHGPKLELGFADQPTPWGAGYDDGIVDHHVHGVGFGQLDGISRRVYAAGASGKAFGADMVFTLSRTKGKRQIDDGGDSIGFYSLDYTTVTGSVEQSF